jgi:hypothetical protein
MLTDGKDLLVQYAGDLLNVSKAGQIEMDIVSAFLDRIEFGATAPCCGCSRSPPRRSTAIRGPWSSIRVSIRSAPVLGTGIPTEVIAERFRPRGSRTSRATTESPNARWKTRFGTSACRVQPEQVLLFVDRSLESTSPAALQKLGATVVVHDDHFRRDTEDADWIKKVGELGWVILTKDQRIRHRPLERAAVIATGARLFALTGGEQTGLEMAGVLSKHFEKMVRISQSEPGPFLARVSTSKIVVERLRR